MTETAALPCFGAPVIEESYPPPPFPPSHPQPIDDSESVGSDDEAVTVHEIRSSAIAGDVVQDGEDALMDDVVDKELAEEVASAVDFLAQLPTEETQIILAAFVEGTSPVGHEEAALFLQTLVAHLPDRTASLSAIRSGLRSVRGDTFATVTGSPSVEVGTKVAGGGVSKFLSLRRRHRLCKWRVRGNWEEHFARGDGEHGTRRYFFNKATMKTQWEVPPEFDETIGKPITEEEDEEDG
eukprot:TRINITY_DN56454_c0_g1_i1.p1 TRINITY_DN56454_c0_g1~~TRINITY_DN56454_c0_g1_i1.p1  ORF type:complete len:239 (-),score=48.33 TRINITY_DN56454_c0_g1_i1:196-912(-)